MDVKKCSKCKTLSLKINFYKDNTKNDGYRPSCRMCTNQNYYDNRNRILSDNKIYRKKNRYKINAYERNKRKSDFNYKLISSIRVKTNYAFKSPNNKMILLVGCTNDHFRKWIDFQLYGSMTLENYGLVWCLDHCIPLKRTNENVLYKYTNWINIRPMYIKDNISKGSKIDHRLYLLQEVKAKYFLKLKNDQEGLD